MDFIGAEIGYLYKELRVSVLCSKGFITKLFLSARCFERRSAVSGQTGHFYEVCKFFSFLLGFVFWDCFGIGFVGMIVYYVWMVF